MIERNVRAVLLSASAVVIALALTACSDAAGPAERASIAPVTGGVTGHAPGRAPQATRELYMAQIRPVGDTRVRGTAQFEIVGEWFTAKVRVAGVEPNAHVPQHIHLNATCTPAGGILINLDEHLSLPGEDPGGQPGGDAYPRANQAGVIQYEARRDLADLVAALDGLGHTLDLANRNVNWHEPGTLAVVGCGEIRRIN